MAARLRATRIGSQWPAAVGVAPSLQLTHHACLPAFCCRPTTQGWGPVLPELLGPTAAGSLSLLLRLGGVGVARPPLFFPFAGKVPGASAPPPSSAAAISVFTLRWSALLSFARKMPPCLHGEARKARLEDAEPSGVPLLPTLCAGKGPTPAVTLWRAAAGRWRRVGVRADCK